MPEAFNTILCFLREFWKSLTRNKCGVTLRSPFSSWEPQVSQTALLSLSPKFKAIWNRIKIQFVPVKLQPGLGWTDRKRTVSWILWLPELSLWFEVDLQKITHKMQGQKHHVLDAWPPMCWFHMKILVVQQVQEVAGRLSVRAAVLLPCIYQPVCSSCVSQHLSS